MLEQTLRSFIMEGWPPSQIVVFDNTGVALRNDAGINARDQPTYLNYTHLQRIYGVAIYKLPVRLTFSQCQNYFLDVAQHQNITNFFLGSSRYHCEE